MHPKVSESPKSCPVSDYLPACWQPLSHCPLLACPADALGLPVCFSLALTNVSTGAVIETHVIHTGRQVLVQTLPPAPGDQPTRRGYTFVLACDGWHVPCHACTDLQRVQQPPSQRLPPCCRGNARPAAASSRPPALQCLLLHRF